MTFRRQKRLMLGGLALLAPLPLPFNEVLEWPVLFLYLLAVVAFLQRAENDRDTRPPNWVLNLLGLLYLPLLIVDLQSSFFRGRAVTALLHLILFLVVVKLFALDREKEKWHLLVALFFVFVAAMATSSHLSVAPYLLAFTLTGLWLLARFAYLHMLTASGALAEPRSRPRLGRPLSAVVLLVLLAAVPLFALAPRFGQPMILGRGGANAGLLRSAGFSDQVDLSLTTTVRSNRTVVMRVEVEGDGVDVENLRFKGNAFGLYKDRTWHRERSFTRTLPEVDGLLLLTSRDEIRERRVAEAEIYLEPIGSTSLVLPINTLGFDPEGRRGELPSLGWGGDVYLASPPADTLRYHAVLAREPVIASFLDPSVSSALGLAAAQQKEGREELAIAEDSPTAAPGDAGGGADAGKVAGEEGPVALPDYLETLGEELPAALDQGGITPEMRRLAAQVMGGGPLFERIRELESYLRDEYRYTLDFVGREGEDPISDFLFVYRSGHCELFATAMVLLLRSQGVPARLVTGFLGAEPNALESYFVVRQSNSHAWVEAYSPEEGWGVYDPTPAEGLPGREERSLGRLFGQLYDYLTFRWDRYVLSFGAEDQGDIVGRIRAWLEELRRRVSGSAESPPRQDSSPPAEGGEETPWVEAIGGPEPRWIVAAVAGCALLWLLLALLHGRRSDAAAAYRRLRVVAARTGVELTDASPPLTVARRLAARIPAAVASIDRVIGLYLEESFAGRTTRREERRELRRAITAIERAGAELRRRERRGRRAVTASP